MATITVTASDGMDDGCTQTIMVTVDNTAPMAQAQPSLSGRR